MLIVSLLPRNHEITNTAKNAAITAKEVDEKYLSKEMFRQFEKHMDGRFDSVETSLNQILNFIKKD